MTHLQKNYFLKALIIGLFFIFCTGPAMAGEVDKGKIPDSDLEKSKKKLSWGVPIWDEEEAIAALKSSEKVLWVDTRPESFIKKGTVRDAVNLIYNKKGLPENTLTAESLADAVAKSGLTKDNAKIIMFCQGPKCHRSYNAAYTATTEWGYNADNIIWFRAGYPYLEKMVKEDAKLKRKAKKYLSDEGVEAL